MIDERRGSLQEVETLHLPDTISCIAISQDHIAAGCLDDSYHVWSYISNKGPMITLKKG